MREFVVRIVMDVLRHVAVEIVQCIGVRFTPRTSRNFVVLNTTQFVILLPQIRFYDFRGGKEFKNGRVAWGQTTVA